MIRDLKAIKRGIPKLININIKNIKFLSVISKILHNW